MTARGAFLALAAVVGLGCSKDPTVVPVRNLERPSDMGFVCLRLVTDPAGATTLTGRPLTDCHPHLADLGQSPDPTSASNGGTLRTFGLATNTARGELAVVDLNFNRLVDLDSTQPGFNLAPLGVFPEVIAASQDGCLAVSANRGSCDLALVDPARMLSQYMGRKAPSTGPGPATRRIAIKTGKGVTLQVAPQEIAFVPRPITEPAQGLKKMAGAQADPPPLLCKAEGANVQGEAQPVPWRVVVTFPSCDLVAVVELPSGTIVSSMYVRAGGVEDAGTEPVCPIDCGAGVTPAPFADASAADAPEDTAADAVSAIADAAATPPDASLSDAVESDAPAAEPDASAMAADGGTAGDAGARPDADPPVVVPGKPLGIGALAVRPEGNRLYVGGFNAGFITAIDITDGKLERAHELTVMMTGAPPVRVPRADNGHIPLYEGAGGVTRLRLSIDPLAVQNQRMGRYLGGDQFQFLYAFARDNSLRVLEVRIDDQTGMRGLHERECDVNVDPLQFPKGTTLAQCYPLESPDRPRRRALARGPGLRLPTVINPELPPAVPRDIAFASLTLGEESISGDFGYILSSNPNQAVYILNIDSKGSSKPPANTFRDVNLGPNGRGAPVVASAPSRDFNLTEVPLPTRVSLAAEEGPRLEGIPTSDPAENRLASVDDAVNTWVWFPDMAAATPQAWLLTWEGVLPGTERGRGTPKAPGTLGPAGTLEDLGAEFCQVGALPKDVVLFPGCSLDSDCLPAGSAVCRQTVPGTPGLCFPKTVAKDAQVLERCARHLVSRRRYEVLRSSPRRLELGLKVDELPTTSLSRCETDAECQRAPFEGFSCRAVREGEPKRCVKLCGSSDGTGRPDDGQCRIGTVCEEVFGSTVGPLCVEGPPLLPECWPDGAPYRVQAGQSFLVTGSGTARPPVARQVGDQCVPDLGRNPLLSNRIPLDAPHCADVQDLAVSGDVIRLKHVPRGPPGTWGNPCLFQGGNVDTEDGQSHVKALFQNQEIRFLMTNLEKFAGDANIARFEVAGGFSPDVAILRDDVLLTIGARILTGPLATPESAVYQQPPGAGFFPYVYVIDQGRTSTSPAARGQILRLNPRGGSQGLPLFDSNFTRYPFQIQ